LREGLDAAEQIRRAAQSFWRGWKFAPLALNLESLAVTVSFRGFITISSFDPHNQKRGNRAFPTGAHPKKAVT
jgi:hypothetical protein